MHKLKHAVNITQTQHLPKHNFKGKFNFYLARGHSHSTPAIIIPVFSHGEWRRPPPSPTRVNERTRYVPRWPITASDVKAAPSPLIRAFLMHRIRVTARTTTRRGRDRLAVRTCVRTHCTRSDRNGGSRHQKDGRVRDK